MEDVRERRRWWLRRELRRTFGRVAIIPAHPIKSAITWLDVAQPQSTLAVDPNPSSSLLASASLTDVILLLNTSTLDLSNAANSSLETTISCTQRMSRKFVAEDERTPGNTHVLLITTGSVASIKAPLIVAELLAVSQESYDTCNSCLHC